MRGGVAGVVGGLDEQAAGVGGPGLGDRALATLGVRGALEGTTPRKPDSSVGVANRAKLATSAHSSAAERVSMPRKQRSRAITPASTQAARRRDAPARRFTTNGSLSALDARTEEIGTDRG
jgi:hypothetical protein